MSKIRKLFIRIKRGIDKKISYKLLIAFLIIGLIPLVLVNLYIRSTYSKKLINELDAQNILVEKSIISDLDNLFVSLEQISIVFYQESIVEILKKEEGILDYKNNSDIIEKTVRINQDLYKSMDNFEQISLVKKEGEAYHILNSKRSIYDFDITYDENIEVNRYKNQRIVPVREISNVVAPSDDFYVYVRKINDITGEIGQLYIVFDKTVISDIFSQILKQSHIEVWIRDIEGRGIYGRDITQTEVPHNTYRIDELSLDVTFFRDYKKAFEIVTMLKRITYLLIVLSVIFLVIASMRLSNYLVKPIESLIDKLNDVKKGDYTKRLEINAKDELGELGKAFNDMITEIDRLINQNLNIKLKENEATIAALQTQINPHFLYNTLEMIKNMSDLYGVMEISNVILALSNTFRYATSTSQYIVRIEDELENLENYITIVDARYRGNISFEIKIDSLLKKEEIIKVCLQPIVENAISHGISKSGGKGTIKIRFEKIDKNIIISIFDDGRGIPAKKLNEIQNSFNLNNNDDLTTTDSVGLKNINERIKLHYGNEYGLTIKSTQNVGTEVKVIYPIRRKK